MTTPLQDEKLAHKTSYGTIKAEPEQVFKSDSLIIDQVIDERGVSLQTLNVVFFCILSISIEGLHFNIFGFMLIPLTQHYSMTDNLIKLIGGSLFLGIGLGSLSIGYLTHHLSRTFVLRLFLLITVLCSIFIAAVDIVYVFAILRTIMGFSIGVTVPVSLNLVSEYLPTHSRSVFLNCVWIGFPLGQLLLLGVMLGVMPNMEAYKTQAVFYWTIIPGILALLYALAFVRDGPRNLIINNQTKEAFVVLEKIYGQPLTETTRKKILQELQPVVKEDENGYIQIFNSLYLRRTLLLIFVWILCSVISYGISLIQSLTMKSVGKVENISNNEVIKEQFYVVLIATPATFIGGWISEIKILGRIYTTIISCIISIGFLILCITVSTKFAFFLGLFGFSMTIAFNVTTAYSAEVYPTKYRDVAMGILFAFTRLGGILSQVIYIQLNHTGVFAPYYFSIVMLLVIIVLIFFMPFDTVGMPLDSYKGDRNSVTLKDEANARNDKYRNDSTLKIEDDSLRNSPELRRGSNFKQDFDRFKMYKAN